MKFFGHLWKYSHHVIGVLFLLAVTLNGSAQDLDLQVQKIAQGLSQNTVTTMVQDQYGFMWIGTRNGLNRFDGVEITQYDRRFNDSISVSHGFVNHVFEDSEGVVWVGTREGGLNWYHRERDEFINVRLDPDPNNISSSSVTFIYEDQHANFWLGTQDHGLILFNRDSQTYTAFKHQPNDPFSISSDHISRIFEDAQGNLWIGTRYQGLNQFDWQNQRFYRYQHQPSNANSLSDNAIRDVLLSRNGNVWVGTQHGLNLLYQDSFNQTKFKQYLHDIDDTTSISHNVVVSLEEDNYGNIWVGTENGGLSIYDPRRDVFGRYYHNPKDPTGLGNNSFWAIYKDNSGIIWLGPLNSGLNLYDPNGTQFDHQKVKPYLQNTLSHNNVTCFLEDPKGNIWIGTDGGGLNYYNRVTKTYTHYRYDPQDDRSLASNAVLSLIYDKQGRLWVGTWEGGLNLFDSETKSFTRLLHDPDDPQSISSNNIFSMLLDSNDNFWVASSRGALELFDPDQRTFTHFKEPGYPTTSIYKIYEDRRQQLWLASEQGLSKFNRSGSGSGTFTHFNYKPESEIGLTARVVINIYEDSKNNFWIGTEGGGLNLFLRDEEKFVAYTKSDGLPNDVIYAILEDDEGYLWLTTNKGLCKFNPQNNEVRNYDYRDGLQADEFIRGSYLITRSGQFYIGGINGFNSFYPYEIKNLDQQSTTLLTDFKINNKSVKATDKDSPLHAHINEVDRIELKHDQSVISFDYVAPNYAKGAKNNYQYILEGYDNDWQDVGGLRRASYTQVPPGRYTFRVRSSNNDQLWSTTATSLDIIIKPPWWKTPWAYLAYLLLAVGLLMWGRRAIIHRERLKSNLRLEHLELKKMQELDQMKSRFFTNISHEFRTPLTLIKEPLASMYNGDFVGNSKNQYRIMLRNTQKLLRLINQLLDLSKLGVGGLKLKAAPGDLNKFLSIVTESFRSQADRQGIAFEYVPPPEPLKLYFDPVKMEDVICNLLSNAFKYTPEYGSVTMTVTLVHPPLQDQPWARISVKDTGIGIPQDQLNNIFDRFYQGDRVANQHMKGTGIGLALTKELVDLHHGTITIESELDEGSEFIVMLPCGSSHLKADEIVALPEPEVTEYGELRGLYYENASSDTQTENSELPLILVVEDNLDMRAHITEHLEINHRIIEASNGKEALVLAIKHLPELIISDIRMPVMGGITLCKKIKEDERVSHIPIILLTGRVGEEDEIKGLEHGADYYFTKPFNSKLLELRVNNIIQSRQALRKHFAGDQKIYLEPSQINLSSSDDRFLKEALSIVEQNISNPDFTVIEFGKELGLSRMKLYRKLKSLTGQSANEFIRTIRLKRAAQLIEQDQLTIAEITYEVGFNDLQYFRECFKKQFQTIPSKYLQKLRDETSK